MKKIKTYSIREASEILGISKQRISQKINGYTKKHIRKSGKIYAYQHRPMLTEKMHYYYDRTKIVITALGLKQLQK